MLRCVQKLVTSLLLALVLALALWMVCFNAIALAGGPGDLDPSFGLGGVVTTTVSTGNNFVSASGRGAAIQADGKIVVAGYSFNHNNADFGVVRYNLDGSLDTGFGNGGIITTSIQNGQDYAEDIAIQADGKILVAGPTTNVSETAFALVRYLPNGELDSNFGIGGIVTTTFDSNVAFNQAVAVQGDGKIVTVGFARVGDQDDFALVRYHPGGSLDTGFGSGGKVTTSFSSGNDYGMDVAIQADSKIVVAGRKDYGGANPDFAVARYDLYGNLDASFGSGGKVITSISNNDERAYELVIQPDGKIVVAGVSSYSFSLVCYHPDGSPDTNFGSGGVVTTSVGSHGDFGPAVTLQANGKILLAGHSMFGGDSTFTLLRYDANGSLDTGFGSSGIVTEPAGGGLAAALQADGKIVAAGSGSSASAFTVVRYLGDPTLPSSSNYLPIIVKRKS